jgi:hypothetical protein
MSLKHVVSVTPDTHISRLESGKAFQTQQQCQKDWSHWMALANACAAWKSLRVPCGLRPWITFARKPANTPLGKRNVIKIIFFRLWGINAGKG